MADRIDEVAYRDHTVAVEIALTPGCIGEAKVSRDIDQVGDADGAIEIGIANQRSFPAHQRIADDRIDEGELWRGVPGRLAPRIAAEHHLEESIFVGDRGETSARLLHVGDGRRSAGPDPLPGLALPALIVLLKGNAVVTF